MTQPSQALQTALMGYALRAVWGKTSSVQIQNFENALLSSPQLVTDLNNAFANNNLTGFSYLPPTPTSSATGAYYDPSSKTIFVSQSELDILVQPGSPNVPSLLSIIAPKVDFTIGHEVQHALNNGSQGAPIAGVQSSMSSLDSSTYSTLAAAYQAGNGAAASQTYILSYVTRHNQDEGAANIEGWNDTLASAVALNGGVALSSSQFQSLLGNSPLAFTLFDKSSSGFFTLKSGLTSNSDGSISLTQNNDTVAGSYNGQNNTSIRMPDGSLVDYLKYYGAAALSNVINLANHTSVLQGQIESDISMSLGALGPGQNDVAIIQKIISSSTFSLPSTGLYVPFKITNTDDGSVITILNTDISTGQKGISTIVTLPTLLAPPFANVYPVLDLPSLGSDSSSPPLPTYIEERNSAGSKLFSEDIGYASNGAEIINVAGVGDVAAVAGATVIVAPSSNVTVQGVGTVTTGATAAVVAEKSATYAQAGAIIGSTLGHYLAGGSSVDGIIYSSLLGTLGQDLGALIANGGNLSLGFGSTLNQALGQFGGQFATALEGATAGTVSGLLMTELSQAIGLKGFGGELFDAAAGAAVQPVLQKVIANVASQAAIFAGFDFGNASNGIAQTATNGKTAVTAAASPQTLVAGAIGAFLGAKLGALVVSPQTQAAEALSSIGSAVGAWAFTSASAGGLGVGSGLATSLGLTGNSAWLFGNLVLPGVGAFVGFVLGALIGNLFGHKKQRIPTANAQTVLQLPYANYAVGSVSSANGGNVDLVKSEAQVAANTLNGLIAEVTGGAAPSFVANSTSPTQVYGLTGSQLWIKLGGTSATQINVDSGDQAVDQGVLWALPQTQIIGGDIFVKRAIGHTAAASVASLAGDIQVASDYSFYTKNRKLINSYISGAYSALSQAQMNFYSNNKTLIDTVDTQGVSALNLTDQSTYYANQAIITAIVGALQDQSIANPWIITIERANELGLMNLSTSDFYGGFQGFLSSFGLGAASSLVHYENVNFNWDGTNLNLTLPTATGQGVFSILPTSSPDGSSLALGGFANGVSSWGYTILAPGTPFFTTTLIYVPPYGMLPVSVPIGNAYESDAGSKAAFSFADNSTGDHVIIGGDGGNTITGGAGFDWIRGGAGSDNLTGGSGFTTIIAGAGTTTITSGSGGGYFAGGSGIDTVYTNAAAATVVGGTGTSTQTNVYAGSGATTFIVSPYSAWDQVVGSSGGSATISFERYTHGVTADLTNHPTWLTSGWGNAHASYLYQSDTASPTGFDFSIGVEDTQTNLIGSSYNDFLKTSELGGVLEGGSGADQLVGGGGRTVASYRHSSSGVYVDLSTGTSYGGDATGDTFSNVQDVVGSNFNDELKGVAGSILNGLGGSDIYDFSGGSNQFIGGTGFNTVDYSSAPSGLYVDLRSGTGSVSGYGQDSYTNISRIVGSPSGSTVYGASGGSTFVSAGGSSNFIGQGGDTVELDRGGGSISISDTNSLTNTLTIGSGLTFDNLWLGTVGGSSGYLQIGVRGTSDVATIQGNFGAYPISGNDVLKALNMNGASNIDLGQMTFGVGGNGSSGQVLYGQNNAFNMVFAYGGNNTIYADGTAWSSNGAFVVAGPTVNGGTTFIMVSAGDDQIAFERGDGHYILNGVVGGEKTIDFGPTVAADDVIYQVVGNDLYIGVRDLVNSSLTASQVSDYVRVVNGGVQFVNNNTGITTFNTVDYVQAGGTSVDLRTLNINWTIQTTSGGGGGGKGGGAQAPIVFDLTGDGLELTPVAQSDIVTKDKNGIITRMGWVGPTNGILVSDRGGDGKINTTADISFVGDVKGAQTDLQGLAAWDTNGDGVVDSKDAGWSKLKIWVDKNQDGRAEAGELMSLSDLGIASINLKGSPTGFDGSNTIDNYVTDTATFTRADGSTGTAYDVALARQFLGAVGIADTRDVNWSELSSNATIGQMLIDPSTLTDPNLSSLSYQAFTAKGLYDFSASGVMSAAATKRWAAYLDPTAIKNRKALAAAGFTGADSLADIRSTAGPSSPYANRGAKTALTRPQVLVLASGASPNLVSLANSAVSADVGLTGAEEQIAWVGVKDGLLVLDNFGDGHIAIATEASFTGALPDAKTSLQGLGAFDTNGDGVIDASDAAFANLKIWHDANQNGVSDTGELQTLTDAGIKSISLQANQTSHDTGELGKTQILAKATVTYTSGATSTLYDVALAVNDPNAAKSPTAAAQAAAPVTNAAAIGPATASTPSGGSQAPLTTANSTTPDTSGAGGAVTSSRIGEDGPQGAVIQSAGVDPGVSGWWTPSGGAAVSTSLGLSSGPTSLGAASSVATTGAGTSVAAINDAAALQSQMLLRQSMASFQGGSDTGSAPLWARQGISDGFATLAAAVRAQTTAAAASPVPAPLATAA